MNLTEGQISLNRATAVASVKAELGLSSIPPSEWSYEQRTNFNKALAAFIQKNQAAFSQTDLATAQDVAGKGYGELEDTSISWGDFTEELGSNVIAPFKAVGDGVITTFKAASWIIPLAGVVLFVGGIYWLNAKAGKPVKLPGAS